MATKFFYKHFTSRVNLVLHVSIHQAAIEGYSAVNVARYKHGRSGYSLECINKINTILNESSSFNNTSSNDTNVICEIGTIY